MLLYKYTSWRAVLVAHDAEPLHYSRPLLRSEYGHSSIVHSTTLAFRFSHHSTQLMSEDILNRKNYGARQSRTMSLIIPRSLATFHFLIRYGLLMILSRLRPRQLLSVSATNSHLIKHSARSCLSTKDLSQVEAQHIIISGDSHANWV